jgi:hypothetical protein
MIVDAYHEDVAHSLLLRATVGDPFFEPKLNPLKLKLALPVTGALEGELKLSTGPS